MARQRRSVRVVKRVVQQEWFCLVGLVVLGVGAGLTVVAMLMFVFEVAGCLGLELGLRLEGVTVRVVLQQVLVEEYTGGKGATVAVTGTSL